MKALKYFLFLFFFFLKCTIKNVSREYQRTFSYNLCLLIIFFKFLTSTTSHVAQQWMTGC